MGQRQGGVIREVERGGLGEYLGLKPARPHNL